jgi:seryl-tRNA synthetase
MLDLKLLQHNPEIVRNALLARRSDITVDAFEELDSRRRAMLTEVERLKNERNQASSEVARRKRQGESVDSLIAELGLLSDRIKALDAATEEVKAAQAAWMLTVPNVPHSSVPVGRSEEDNAEARRWGQPRTFDFAVREHWELGAALGGLDFERGGKLAGARFAVLHGWAARLERALASFFLDIQTRVNRRTEIAPPFIVNSAAMTGTGNLPKFAADLFKLENWDYYLIPTAEVPVTNLHAGEILPASALPLLYVAHTPCFRSEAGSYGKDTRGLIRQPQFNEVEMVTFSHPDASYDDLETMRRGAEDLLERLELPYRTVVLCTADMGFASAKTYDVEVWLPGQNTYREISSCSNCEAFQSRRANIRFRPEGGGKPEFVHTLNGSGLPTGRTLVAVLENGQQKDGSIVLPKALAPYMGGMEVIEPGMV